MSDISFIPCPEELDGRVTGRDGTEVIWSAMGIEEGWLKVKDDDAVRCGGGGSGACIDGICSGISSGGSIFMALTALSPSVLEAHRLRDMSEASRSEVSSDVLDES